MNSNFFDKKKMSSEEMYQYQYQTKENPLDLIFFKEMKRIN